VVKSDVDDVREVNEKIFNFEGIWQQILDCWLFTSKEFNILMLFIFKLKKLYINNR
jgi:hypothetical protein